MIHIVMGLPGNGKTEVAKLLEKKLHGIRVNTDDVYVRMFPDKKYDGGDFLPGRLEQIYNSLGAIAYYLDLAASDKNIIIEGSFRYKAQREHIFNQIEDKSHVKLVFVEVADEKEIERRITERFNNGAPDTYEDYLKVKAVFERPEDFYYIDNSGTMEDLDKKIDEYIKQL